MVQQGLFQELALRQELQLAPHQILSLEILTVPLLDLYGKINQELESNPTLERLGNDSERLAGDPMESVSASASKNSDVAADAAEKDDYLANLMQLDESWQDYMPPSHAKRYSSADDEERRKYFFDSLTNDLTLEEDLLEQLRTSYPTPEIEEVGELIIGNIDETGYLRTPLDQILPTPNDERHGSLEKALELIQSFDPPGVGARNLRECLMLQLERVGREGELAYTLVERFLDEISRNRVPEICKALDVSSAEVYEAWREIQSLRPRPGSAISPDNVQYVMPEVVVKKVDDDYEVTSNRDYLPRLGISKQYKDILEDPNIPDETKRYVRDKINNSKHLMTSLDQRQSTVHRITEAIVQRQKDFFEIGEDALKPMTMSEVADEIGVHETTVSRAIANKYMDSPRGLLPLRQFFSGGYESASGESVSNRSVKHKIQEIIGQEDPKKPISDQKIAELLKADGLDVARRTVAKYREELGIQSTRMRKSHT